MKRRTAVFAMVALFALSFAALAPLSYASSSYSVVYYLSNAVFSAPGVLCHGSLLLTNSSRFATIYPDFCGSYSGPSIVITSMWAIVYSANGTISSVPVSLTAIAPNADKRLLATGSTPVGNTSTCTSSGNHTLGIEPSAELLTGDSLGLLISPQPIPPAPALDICGGTNQSAQIYQISKIGINGTVLTGVPQFPVGLFALLVAAMPTVLFLRSRSSPSKRIS